jgi:hypothetical protein
MSRLKLKRDIVRLLQEPDLEIIFSKLRKYSCKKLISPLFSCLCHPQEAIRWHAVSAFGVAVPEIARKNLEDARTVMRRFLWMLNDESGGIGWGVPESMGEVMSQNGELAGEYAHMLVSYTLDDGPELFQDGNFLELVTIQSGLLWGLCRVAEKHGDLLIEHGVTQNLAYYFSSPDPQVRGLACRLSRMLGLSSFRTTIAGLLDDRALVRWYRKGNFLDCTVADLAQKALGN